MTTGNPVLKHRPEDFRVRENLVVPLTRAQSAPHRYLLLHKCGYTPWRRCAGWPTGWGCPAARSATPGSRTRTG
ncbi:hypothetical protein ACWV95_33485 [Streptomyces albus]